MLGRNHIEEPIGQDMSEPNGPTRWEAYVITAIVLPAVLYGVHLMSWQSIDVKAVTDLAPGCATVALDNGEMNSIIRAGILAEQSGIDRKTAILDACDRYLSSRIPEQVD